MSVASIITRGYGSFSTVPLLLLHGYGNFHGAAVGGAIWPRIAPPDGYRNILDTAGVDLAADEHRRIDALRRELGVIKDPEPVLEPEPGIIPLEVERPISEPVEIIAGPTFDKMSYAEFVAAALIEAAREEEVKRVEWQRRDDEDVLLLLAGA